MDADALTYMLERDRSEWRALTSILDSSPSDSMHGADESDWNARDVYTHLARWVDHSTDDLEATLAGNSIPRPVGADDEINARWQTEDAGLSLNEARSLAQRAVDRRLAAIQSIPPNRWTPCPRRHRPRRRLGALRRPPQLHRGRIRGVAAFVAPDV